MNLRRQAALFACAVQTLTRLPTPRLEGFHPDWTARAARYYPLVGQIVGALSAFALLAGERLAGRAVGAVLAVAVGALVTGGFHEDGLADTFDGLGGGRTPEARLAIMKDSRIGSYGALALGLVLALRVAALAALSPVAAVAALVFAHGAARAAAVATMRALPYAGDAGAAKLAPAAQPVTRAEVAAALVLAAWPVALTGWRAASLGVTLAAVATLVMAVQARRLIGGYTGDVLGAVEQLAETALLLGVAGVAHAAGVHGAG